MDDKGRNNRLRMAFSEVRKQEREKEWFEFIDQVIGLKDLERVLGRQLHSRIFSTKDFDLIIRNRTSLLSSGQNILIFIITELIANITNDSIVLYDEPETHLHPNAIAKLIKALNNILERYNSFAIIATHSPIVVQETPSRNVRLFDRIGNTPMIKPLGEESFGENLTKINDSIFYLNQVKESYKEYFDQKIKEKTIDEINQEFDNKLSMNALLYLNAIDKKKGRKK
jgi:predicted ATP-dependent endonuclease of OLD family